MVDLGAPPAVVALSPRLKTAGLGVAAVTAVTVGLWWGLQSDPLRGLGAAVAVLIGAGVLYLAVSVPGKSREGLLLGIGIPVAAMMAWTWLEEPLYVWAITAAVGALVAWWTYPWWRDWRELAQLGGFWLAVSLWACGAISALWLVREGVFAGRVVYGGFAILTALLVFTTVRKRGVDISVGIAAGLLICHAALLVLGAQYVFETGDRHTSDSAWGFAQSSRFWGGPWLVYHPNFIAMTALLAAIRIGADSRFAAWLRWGVLGNAMLLLYIADSRTSLLMAGVASVAYAVLHLRRDGLLGSDADSIADPAPRDPAPRDPAQRGTAARAWARALIPLAATLLVFVAAGGSDMLFKDRYHNDRDRRAVSADAGRDMNAALSGRIEIWGMILADFGRDSTAEKVFGNADYPRGEILRHRDPSHQRYHTQPELSADNVLVGALRRGGAVGLTIIIIGGLVVLRRATRNGAPMWVTVVTLAAGASLISEDELVGTTPLWMLVFAGEVWIWHRTRNPLGARSAEAVGPSLKAVR